MATFALIHGAGDVAWSWSFVATELREQGHDVVAVDLPCEDDSAGWSEYADTVVEAIGDRRDVVVVAHSLGGFTAPLVAERVPASLIVLVAGMIPRPGETGNEWWENTGSQEADEAQEEQYEGELEVYLHDVAPDLAAEALAKGRDQSGTPMEQPWPLDSWPDVPTKFLLCLQDRCFPADWMREVVRERLGITPDEIDTGHCPYLARPKELADRLEAYRAQCSSVASI